MERRSILVLHRWYQFGAYAVKDGQVMFSLQQDISTALMILSLVLVALPNVSLIYYQRALAPPAHQNLSNDLKCSACVFKVAMVAVYFVAGTMRYNVACFFLMCFYDQLLSFEGTLAFWTFPVTPCTYRPLSGCSPSS